MAKIQVIITLTEKRQEIEAHIAGLELDLEQARQDLSAIHAAVAVFSGEGPMLKSYMNLSGVFPRRVLPNLCREALEAANGPLSTRELAAYAIKTKGLDEADRRLRKAVAYKVVQIMRRLERTGYAKRTNKIAGAIVWALV